MPTRLRNCQYEPKRKLHGRYTKTCKDRQIEATCIPSAHAAHRSPGCGSAARRAQTKNGRSGGGRPVGSARGRPPCRGRQRGRRAPQGGSTKKTAVYVGSCRFRRGDRTGPPGRRQHINPNATSAAMASTIVDRRRFGGHATDFRAVGSRCWFAMLVGNGSSERRFDAVASRGVRTA
jgi:hypothetical protein